MKNLPNHVAIIMDGNGRWAQDRGLPRLEGHRAGTRAVRRVVKAARELNLRYLTLYAFSSANWGRPRPEVQGLLSLIGDTIVEFREELLESGVRVRVVGELDDLPSRTREPVDRLVEDSAGNTALNLTLALSYGGRQDVALAARLLAVQVAAGLIVPEQIDESLVRRTLSTNELPDPDLLIRTGGERRLSDFLLFEGAYAELHFCDAFWPDFGLPELTAAVQDFSRRERRFGKTSEQVQKQASTVTGVAA